MGRALEAQKVGGVGCVKLGVVGCVVGKKGMVGWWGGGNVVGGAVVGVGVWGRGTVWKAEGLGLVSPCYMSAQPDPSPSKTTCPVLSVPAMSVLCVVLPVLFLKSLSCTSKVEEGKGERQAWEGRSKRAA